MSNRTRSPRLLIIVGLTVATLLVSAGAFAAPRDGQPSSSASIMHAGADGEAVGWAAVWSGLWERLLTRLGGASTVVTTPPPSSAATEEGGEGEGDGDLGAGLDPDG